MVDALIEMVLAQRPVVATSVGREQRQLLIESGAVIEGHLAAVEAKVGRGSLALAGIESQFSRLIRTASLEKTGAYLGWDEKAVRAAASEGRLYVFDVAGRLRFPRWQFHRAAPDGLLPHLAELIDLVPPHWTPQVVSGFMETSQSRLVTEGPTRPTEYIIRTGDFDAVRDAIESSGWR